MNGLLQQVAYSLNTLVHSVVHRFLGFVNHLLFHGVLSVLDCLVAFLNCGILHLCGLVLHSFCGTFHSVNSSTSLLSSGTLHGFNSTSGLVGSCVLCCLSGTCGVLNTKSLTCLVDQVACVNTLHPVKGTLYE